MPGMAANPSIFERIELPSDFFELFFLEWFIPLEGETLLEYANRMAKNIKHENPVLVGVSFGGILVQEISNIIKAKKVIIISSIKSNLEFSFIIKFIRNTKIYKLFPIQLLQIDNLTRFIPAKKRKEYAKFLSVIDPNYLNWAIEQVISWDRVVPDESVIHIHGEFDEVFPIRYIKKCIPVNKGTHIMIFTKYKWFNENLPKIILEKLY